MINLYLCSAVLVGCLPPLPPLRSRAFTPEGIFDEKKFGQDGPQHV
jgi:hypothetical protein